MRRMSLMNLGCCRGQRAGELGIPQKLGHQPDSFPANQKGPLIFQLLANGHSGAAKFHTSGTYRTTGKERPDAETVLLNCSYSREFGVWGPCADHRANPAATNCACCSHFHAGTVEPGPIGGRPVIRGGSGLPFPPPCIAHEPVERASIIFILLYAVEIQFSSPNLFVNGRRFFRPFSERNVVSVGFTVQAGIEFRSEDWITFSQQRFSGRFTVS